MTTASTFLPVFLKNALYENEHLVPMVRAGKASSAEALGLCRNYRTAGICSLLMSASAAKFHHFLRKSAAAFVFCTADTSRRFTLTRSLPPLLDALCSGEFQLAATIARQVGATWDSSAEYEEDFLYTSFLCSHFLQTPASSRDEALVDRYGELVGEGVEPRLMLLTSFLRQDENLFGQGLEMLLAARDARYKRLAAKGAVPLWELATEGFVSIEGLALVALAERKGFQTSSDYLHVPSLARRPAPVPTGSISWEAIYE